MMNSKPTTVSVAMTGASGAMYGLRLIEILLQKDCTVYLMLSKPGQVVIGMETDWKLPGRPAGIKKVLTERFGCKPDQLRVFDKEEWTAPVASGTHAPDAMVICPCTMGTLSAVAVGASRNLIERAADVMLKERRRLVLVPRETPLSAIHLENMLKLTHAGAVILPPNPGFYNNPETVEDVIDFVVARVLDQIGIAHTLMPKWGE